MRTSPLILTLSLLLVAAPATAQSRAKDDSRRTATRQPASADRNERRRDPTQETAARRPIRATVHADRPRNDDRRAYDRDRWRDRWDTRGRVIIVTPQRRFGTTYGRGHDIAYAYGRVWDRRPGMTCLRLDDELEWAHDEWHYRNDHDRHESWYDVEHARLEWRIAQERAYSGCGRPLERRDCRTRGQHPRTGSTLDAAIQVLEILLGEGRTHGRY